MRFFPPSKRSLFCAVFFFSLLPISEVSFAQDDPEVQEVIVTGSFIRRSEGFTQASQTTQLSAEDLEAEGTLNMGQVMQNLSFVNGAASAITNTIQGTDSRSSSIDLRGLGASSTLTLLDGKRLISENVNALIPTIAIRRIDIVADGAAALYGNEAVAGMVNFIPYRSYDGLKIDSYAEGDTAGDYDEHSIQMLWGGNVGELDVVLAGQFRQNSRLGWDERNLLANSGLVFSSNAPGNWYVPDRDVNGAYTGTRSQAPDPNCAPASERTSYQPDVVANPYGMLLNGSCYFDFGDTRSYREPTETAQYFANATWDYSDDLTLSFQGFRTQVSERTYNSTSNPGNARIGELPAVRGEIPGNPFFATDANGNQLYGMDANGDGIPDRQPGVDANGDGTDDYVVAGTIDNGIPLREDVQARTLRPVNKTHTVPTGHSPDMDALQVNSDEITRWTLQADFTVPFLEDWEGMAAYTRNAREFLATDDPYNIEAMKQGLSCDVANDREACYNPFFVTNPADNNSLQVMDAIVALDNERFVDELDTIDIILNGDVPLGGFELPGGQIGAAVGYQWRDNSFTNVPSAPRIAGNGWRGSARSETITAGSREVDAYFAELAIPILPSLELTAAVRREEFSSGQESTDPKYGITWQATEWLTFRATQGDAFIAPTLEQLLDPVTCGPGPSITDRFGPFSAFTQACSGGNPDLNNEISESRQLGFDLTFDNFDVSVTWNKTDFSNRIIDTASQDLMEIDFFNFKQATGFAGSGLPGDQPSEQQLRDWLNSPLSNKNIIRAPDDIYTILEVRGLGSTNAESVKVTAYDIQANYNFGFNNLGDFRIRLQATYIDEFLYQTDPTQPTIDGAGKYNDNTSAAPTLPKIKANLTIGWNRGNHSINTITRYVDDTDYDGPAYAHMDNFGGTFRPGNIFGRGVLAWSQLDAAYTYRGLNFFDGELAMTLGVRNAFDRAPQRSPEFAGVLGALQDPLGRVIYGRLVYDF